MLNESKHLKIVYFALEVLGISLFTAFSFAALFHLLMLISGIYFTYLQVRLKNFTLSMSSFSLLFLIIISILSVLINGAPLKNILKLKYFIIALISIPAFEYLVENHLSEKRIKKLIYFFLIASAIASLSGLIGLWTGFNPLRFKTACHIERACGMYGMYMSYGYGMGSFLIMAIGLMAYSFYKKKSFNIVITVSTVLINFLGFYLSYARGAFVGFALGMATTLLRFQKRIFFYFSGFILITLILSYLLSPTFKKMIHERGSSNVQRLSLYIAAYEAFKEKPILGLGYREFEGQSVAIKKKYNVLNGEQADFAGSAHNNFLEHLASTGILGFLAIISFHLFWFLEMVRRKDWIAKWTTGFIVSLTISGQVEYTLGDGETLFFIMLVYSWSQVKSKKIYEIL